MFNGVLLLYLPGQKKNKAWSFKDTGLSLKAPENLLVHQNLHSSTSKTNSLQPHPPLPVGFINKGNTCYANAILQVMSVLPFSPNINSSLPKFLKLETLEAEKKFFCPSCNCLTESTRETPIIDSGSILVIQLHRFSTSHSRLIKDQQVFNCLPELELKVPMTGRSSIFLQQILSCGII